MLAQSLKPIWLTLVLCSLALAHVGSPDIYLDSKAGPYQLFVTVRPPSVIPGVAQVEVRSETPGVREIRAVPMPMKGAGAKFAPVPDRLTASPSDPQFFTGALWMMAPGSWQVRLTARGPQGEGEVSVPVPSAALMTQKMQRGLGLILIVLGVFLVAGVVAIIGASVREAKLEPRISPGPEGARRGRVAMSIAFTAVIAIVWLGDRWWNSEAYSYSEDIYKPLQMRAALTRSGVLTLMLNDPGWLRPKNPRVRNVLFVRTMDDLVPDHDHLMHLYMIRQPGLDVVYHLHPEQVEPGSFQLPLPSMPAGTYKLYADIVHSNGFPETMVTAIDLPAMNGRPLTGDDARGTAGPWEKAPVSRDEFSLPDGYRMEWVRESETWRAKRPVGFRFRLLDASGNKPADMALYMGMLGHAAFVKTDGSVFAHIHPAGSISMAAFMLAQSQTEKISAAEMDMAGMDHAQRPPELPNQVTFPYGFPTPGRYRIFVQMKHGNTVETGVFDASVQ